MSWFLSIPFARAEPTQGAAPKEADLRITQASEIHQPRVTSQDSVRETHPPGPPLGEPNFSSRNEPSESPISFGQMTLRFTKRTQRTRRRTEPASRAKRTRPPRALPRNEPSERPISAC